MIAALNSQNVGALNSVSGTTNVRATPGVTNSGPAAVSAISPQAELFAKLSELKDSDPEQFQATLSKMSDELRSAAKEQGGAAAQHLNGLADKVAEAAKTGDLSLLQPDASKAGGKAMAGRPAGGPPPGGGRPPSGAGAGASKKSSPSEGSSDPADTNGDGTVSAAEEAIYALTHSPSKATDSGAASTGAASTGASSSNAT
ncbi:MAG TPA: hypothetical protein VGJ91_20790 [Polyangiaceae bacterium]|jgi:hypothetical protein